jgi:hypothetical protein
MSDERDLTPEQEARVARLLADARADEPIPAEVAARLDRVLAGMASEQIAGPGQQIAPVIDIAARRRRRVRTLLVAAAAVVVAGVGIGQLVEPGGDSDDSGGDSASSEVAADDADGGGRQPEGPASIGKDEQEALGTPARITTDSFAADVRRFQDRPGIRSEASDGTMIGMDQPAADFSCSPAAYGPGKLVAVRYNGQSAVLAYRPAAGETQVVELLQCGSAEVVRSTTIPLP